MVYLTCHEKKKRGLHYRCLCASINYPIIVVGLEHPPPHSVPSITHRFQQVCKDHIVPCYP